MLLFALVQMDPEHQAMVGPLLGAYTLLTRDWEAWTEEEDESVTAVIDAACQLTGAAELLLTPQIPGTPAPMEGLVVFLARCMEAAPACAAARAAHRVHAVLSMVRAPRRCCALAVAVAVARATGCGGGAAGSVSFARLTLHYALTYAHAANLTHPRASGSEN